MTLWSPNPGKAWVERMWLAGTAVWGAACGVVMLGGVAEGWTDRELMPFGVVLGLGMWLAPVVWPAPSERAIPWHARSGFRFGLAVAVFAFGMNYLCTPYFFDVLHMRFGFGVELRIENNPVFLYFLTVAYFATYAVLGNLGWRWVARKTGLHGVRLWLAAAPVAAAIAFLETALNANPWMTALFCFEDLGFMLTFGSLSYGVALWLAMPVYVAVCETPGRPEPLRREVGRAVLALAAITLGFAVLRHTVAPLVTEVETAGGAVPRGQSCLARATE